jgi:hypothetical protein
MKVVGDLTVSHKGELELELKHEPEKVEITFVDEEDCEVPCNPKVHDKVSWELHQKHHKTFVKIFWNVSGVRKISWIIE